VSNWFLGLPLELGHGLELPAPPPGARLLHAADLHVTLAFLGPVGAVRARRAAGVFEDLLRSRLREPIEVTFERALPLGPSQRFSVVAATLGAGRATCEALLAELRNAPCDAIGVARDPRPPLPHVTLARVDRRAGLREREHVLAWAAKLDLSKVRARLASAALFTRASAVAGGELSAGPRPRYTRVLEWDLHGRDLHGRGLRREDQR